MFLMLACNDHRNGAFTGACDQLHLELPDGERLEVDGFHARVAFGGRTFTLGRVRVPHRGHGTWVGNWVWDSADLDPVDAAAVARAEALRVRLEHLCRPAGPDVPCPSADELE